MSFKTPETSRGPNNGSPHPLQTASLCLLYHELSPVRSDYGYALTTSAFGEHLELVRQARDAGDGWLWPEITFDDGHISNFEYALPMLSSAGLTARFFITAGWTSRRPEYMDWHQLRELQASGQRIGAHGWSHTLLTHCSDAELETELKGSRLLLEDKLSAPVTTMSLPGGRYNSRVLRACENAGYTQVFTSIPRAGTSPSAKLIGRLNIRTDTDRSWLEAVLRPETGALRRLQRLHRLKETAQRMLGDRLYHKLWARLNRESAAAQATV